MDFANSVDNRGEIKESKKKIEEYFLVDKKMRNMKVTVIPIVIGALGTVPQNLKTRR